MIVNSGHDENGRLWGGRLGDQGAWTGYGEECAYRTWYGCPWHRVFRHPNQRIAATIAANAMQAAGNDLIGYDQLNRETFWEQLQACGTYCAKDIDVACAMDCSSGVAAFVKAAGVLCGDERCAEVRPDTYTGNEEERLLAAGFVELTDSAYLESDDYLLPGDILLRDNYHTATNVSVGRFAGPWDPEAEAPTPVKDDTDSYGGVFVCVTDDLNVRDGYGLESNIVYSNGYRVHYSRGETVMLADWRGEADGYVWGRYVSHSGKIRYLAIGTEDGSETYLERA